MRERLQQVAGTLEREAGADGTRLRDAAAASSQNRRRHGMIRVLIAEDQAMVLGALAALIDIEQDLEVVGAGALGDRRRSKPPSR